MCMSVNEKLLNLINLIKAKKSQRVLLKELRPGDMVWAKMPLKSEELEKIEETHRIRPYLVMWKDRANIYAYMSSSKKSVSCRNYETYMINRLRYTNRKDSWLDLRRIVKVPVNCLMDKMCHLERPDLLMIEKRLQMQRNRKMIVERTFGVPFSLQEGDVVRSDNVKYYVLDSNEMNTHCYMLTKRLKEGKNAERVKIDGKLQYIYFEKKTLWKDEVVRIIDMAGLEERFEINRLMRKRRE